MESTDNFLNNHCTFCAYGFYHVNIRNDGKVALCCRAANTISFNGREMSLHHDTFDAIWNSSYMKEVRYRMISGQPITACSGCYREELQGGKSLRMTANNEFFILGERRPEEVYEDCKTIVSDEEAVAPLPISVHFMFGNLCNLKCRTCTPSLSSKVAADPIHSHWASGDKGLARVVTLLPDFINQVNYMGFGELVSRDGVVYRLLPPHQTAVISLANSGDPIRKIVLSGIKDDDEPCTLIVSLGKEHETQFSIIHKNWSKEISFTPPIECLSEIFVEIRLENSESRIGIRNVSLTSAPPLGKAYPREFVSRLSENPNWYDNKDVLLKEILGCPEKIRFLNFSGGEPLISENIELLLNHFVTKGLSRKIGLYFSTNGTINTPKISDLLKKFRYVGLGVSIDGIGNLQEYIRPPVKWNTILNNLCRYIDEGIGSISIRPTPQAYNVFGLLDLVRFCDKYNMEFALSNVLYGPRYLSFDMLPQAIIDEELAEWELYLTEECRPQFKREVGTVIGALKRPRPDDISDLQKQFVDFTRDLDNARGQSLETANPRLYQRLFEQGVILNS